MGFSRQIAAALLFASPLAGQASIDEGSFTLYVNGARIGREQFSVRRADAAGRTLLLSRATTTLGTRRLEVTFRSDTSGQPIEYLIEEQSGGKVIVAASGDVVGGRFVQRVARAKERAEKEVRLEPRMLITDDETVFGYYFTAQVGPGTWAPVLNPRRLSRDSVSVSVRSTDIPVETGNGLVPARHLIVVNSSGQATDIWVDAQGRLLRVAVQSRGFVAVRDEPPR